MVNGIFGINSKKAIVIFSCLLIKKNSRVSWIFDSFQCWFGYVNICISYNFMLILLKLKCCNFWLFYLSRAPERKEKKSFLALKNVHFTWINLLVPNSTFEFPYNFSSSLQNLSLMPIFSFWYRKTFFLSLISILMLWPYWTWNFRFWASHIRTFLAH
jgi:hypothetical protein